MIRIAETKEGFLDLVDLENQLRYHQNYGRQMIGCFSVASNVTGIVIDDVACTILLHQYQALAFWDYNIAAPCITIDMNPFVPGVEENSANKDAIYFSGHKFIGGVQTPGILIAKKTIFRHLNSCETDGFFTSQEYNKV
jgi:selenocysteine lyase/cysteine desulfurase